MSLGRPKIKMKCEPLLTKAEMADLPPKVRRLFQREKSCRFRQTRPFRAARFVRKKDKREFAIVHPSTKEKGKCQVSYFDQDGPYSDTIYKNCTAALKEIRPQQWKLVDVE